MEESNAIHDNPLLPSAATATANASSSSSSLLLPSPSTALEGKAGVCRVEVARVEFLATRPWQRTQQTRASGTAFCIAGQRLLTSAHVVRSAVDIRVRQYGSTVRFPATVVVYAPDCDLALLEIAGEKEREEFFANDNLALELADQLPALRENVHVVGYPTGGTTICITEGIVSRIDMISASAFNNLLAIQIDAAINPGNSGGPAFDSDGKVTGVAFLKNAAANTDSIGYLIPADVVRTFLGRCDFDNGMYTLSPSLPYHWHKLENRSLRLFHQVPDHVHGILLTSVCDEENSTNSNDDTKATATSSMLQKGDVLTHIDGKPVADDGQVVLRGDELIQHRYLLRGKAVDETTLFTVYRNGQSIQCTPTVLRDIPTLCLRWAGVDYQPDYLILGALVLLPLSWALRSQKKCGTHLIDTCMDWCKRWPREWEGCQGLVVLTDIYACELSFSYSRPWRRVLAYNGVRVLSLQHLSELWEASCRCCSAANDTANSNSTSFARIELDNDDDVVFEVKAAMEAQAAIMETHQIPKACNISPPNPKYK